MKIEIESLARKFQACRIKANGKKVIYPVRLRKTAAHLAADYPVDSLARELGVSKSTVRTWINSFDTSTLSQDDLVPVEITEPQPTRPSPYKEIKVKITALEVNLPSSELAASLGDIIQGMGRQSC
jgi:transposase-like protein